TATLGGYNELLLLGGLTLFLSYDVTHDHPRSFWRWGLLGLSVGLGWWTHGLIVVYALPVAIMVLARTIIKPPGTQRTAPQYILWALAAFLLGSAPWWIFDLQHNGAAISTFLTNRQTGEFAGIGIPYVPPTQRALGLLLVGLPTLIGLRFPWSSAYFLLPVGVLVASVYLVAVYRLFRSDHALQPDARPLVLGLMGLFLVIFIASTFGADPTGRYFLPLALPLGIILGTLVDGLWGKTPANLTPTPAPSNSVTRWLAVALVIIVVGYQGVGQITAATTAPGFTTQFDLVSHLPNDYDGQLIRFLEERGLTHGYTNYWVAYRLAFLSGERLQYSAALPYKTTLSYNPADNRYPPYAAATAEADKVAYITSNLPELDAYLQTAFQQQNLTYQMVTIGPYTIYSAFEPHNPTPIPFP
ncbi:MAG TPA: hypothetical protein VHO69_16910, partial [Phototrophicaceae bacterium]|nr:hypothetical protein [Phototrophicaceae bacterium]